MKLIYGTDSITSASAFLRSGWVCFDTTLRDGTPLSLIQQHYARFQGEGCLTPSKLGEKDFAAVNREWKINRPQCCCDCTGREREDLTKLKKYDKKTCKLAGHKLGTYNRRIRYLRLVSQNDTQ